MPRDGALTLSDVREPTRGRRGCYSVARLMAENADAMLTDLLVTLAGCPKARSATPGVRLCTVSGCVAACHPARAGESLSGPNYGLWGDRRGTRCTNLTIIMKGRTA
jgi:hypothetical protein